LSNVHARIRRSELRVIERIEGLCAELDLAAFPQTAHGKALEQADIDVGRSRRKKNIPPGIAVLILRCGNEGCFVKPVLDAAPVPRKVAVIDAVGSCRSGIGAAHAQAGSEGLATMQSDDGADLPSTGYGIQEGVCEGEMASAAERQIVQRAADE